jgi:hypothetical protein
MPRTIPTLFGLVFGRVRRRDMAKLTASLPSALANQAPHTSVCGRRKLQAKQPTEAASPLVPNPIPGRVTVDAPSKGPAVDVPTNRPLLSASPYRQLIWCGGKGCASYALTLRPDDDRLCYRPRAPQHQVFRHGRDLWHSLTMRAKFCKNYSVLSTHTNPLQQFLQDGIAITRARLARDSEQRFHRALFDDGRRA